MTFSPVTWLTYIKLNTINADGQYNSDVSGTYFYPAATRGPATSQPPFQVSMVASLQGAGRAPGSRGRIYLPPQAITVNQNGDVGDTIAGNFAAGVKELIDELHTWPGAPAGEKPRLIIASNKGTQVPVLEVRVGTVPDTQRRRRRQLVEASTVVPLAAAAP